jgi:two-component system CheB/CheR fusion protein
MVAEFLVGIAGDLLAVNEEARVLFGMDTNQVSQPLSSLPASSHPVELAPLIDRAYAESHTVLVENIPYQLSSKEWAQLDLRVAPLLDVAAETIGVSIAFSNMTRYYQSQNDLQSSQEQLEKANEELQSTNEELETTNEELQSTVEELETTNEELQSSNEELETTNEELQSSNEELETMNEELQATNEELQTMNEQLRQRSEELVEVNEYLDSVLASLHVGISVLDRDLFIRNWNTGSQELWGLNAAEAEGKSIIALDIGLPVEQLVEPINQCMKTGGESQKVVLKAVNRRGRPIDCQITCSPMVTPQGIVEGAVLMMEEQEGTGTDVG